MLVAAPIRAAEQTQLRRPWTPTVMALSLEAGLPVVRMSFVAVKRRYICLAKFDLNSIWRLNGPENSRAHHQRQARWRSAITMSWCL